MKTKIFLGFIIILAFILRFYRLGDYPAFNADEAAIGYNAYSLIQTGRDEHGNSWPIHFQSFNDYKPGLYFYIALPFVKILGLNEWAVRIPGATLGVLTVLIVYLLVRELFNNEKLALVSSLFLAVSPWHIHFSRGGWEVNAATFFITLGFWLFLRAIKKPGVLTFTLSLLTFILSLYTYHAARIVVPLLVLGLLVIYRERLLTNIKPFLIASLIGLILLIPLAKELAGPAGISRAAGVGLFANPGPLSRVNEQRGEHGNYQGFAAKILHNKPVNYGLAFLENWTKHFDGNFLFLSGDDIQRDKVPETGVMYIFDFFFLVVGFAAIIKRPNGWVPILLWLVIAPVASALTFQSPHALRAENMVIPLTVISAFGLYEVVKLLNGYIGNKKLRTTCYILLAAVILWNFSRYLHMYYIHMAKEYPYSSQYGVKELVSYVKENSGKYNQIYITDRYDQPYILFLFYLKYPPAKFQKEHTLTNRDIYGFSTVRKFDKYTFVSINWEEVKNLKNVLVVGTPGEIPSEGNVIKKILFPNGKPAFEIVAL